MFKKIQLDNVGACLGL